MSGTQSNPRQLISPDRTQIARYASLSLGCFLCTLVLLGLLLWKADKLSSLGLTGNLYYISLLPLGLSVAGFLFGALQSYASYRGKRYGGSLVLRGPVVAFFLVIILGFVLPKPSSNFPLTIYVHGKNGPQDLVLRGNGYVLIDIGGLRRKAAIGSDGEAIFTEIPANFRGQNTSAVIDAEGYEVADPKLRIRLDSASAYLPVTKKTAHISGHIKNDSGQLLAGVRVSIGELATTTDAGGYFYLSIPGDRIQPNMTLTAVSQDYTVWTDVVVPNSNEVSITLHH